MSKKEYIIPIFIPFLGCPHDCAFCNQVKITNYKDNINKENTIRQINQYLSYFPKNENLKEIAFFGGSFTGLDKKVMISYLEIALNYKKKGIIDRIRLSTRPDYINNSILDILKKYEVDVIEQMCIRDRLFIAMIKVGEDSGDMTKSLKKSSNYYANEYIYRLKRISRLAEPFLILFMALVCLLYTSRCV